MPAVLAGIDLVTLMAILTLMGLLIATAYTFEQLANVLDVSIGPYHPFKGVADDIRKYVVGGIKSGISALGTVSHDLWAGLKWSVEWAISGLETLGNDAVTAVTWLWKNAVPAYVKAAVAVLAKVVGAIDTRLTTLTTHVGTEVARLDAKIDTKVTALKTTLEGELTAATKTVESDLHAGLRDLKGTVESDIRSAVQAAEAAASAALLKVQIAEDAAIIGIGALEDVTTKELHDFIKSVPLTDLKALLVAVPILAALVDAFLTETGLNNEICRTKVKGVCGTNPTAWFRMLEGLLAIGAGLSLEDVFKLAQETAEKAMPIVHSVVRG